jgi:hypothetical protein
MDIKELPQKLETLEDYDLVCTNFLLPYLREQAEQTVEVIQKLHRMLSENTEITQEQIDLYVNELRQLNAFANPEGVMYPYFKQIADLEAKLEAEGHFK